MALVAKRKVRQSWREAVAARLESASPERLAAGLAAFDARLGKGAGDAEVAYAVLAEAGLLWEVDAPGFSATATQPDAASRHTVPAV